MLETKERSTLPDKQSVKPPIALSAPDELDGKRHDFLPSGMVTIVMIAVAEGVSAILRRRHETLREFIHAPEGSGATVFRKRRGNLRIGR